MEQMSELLKAMKEMVETQIGSVTSWIDVNLKIIVEIKAWRKETRACQEMMEGCLGSKEPTSVEVRVGSGA
jgi:hypothetical protein